MSNIRVRDLTDVEEKFIEAVHILIRMRRAQKKWHEHFGARNRLTRQEWEQKADDFIASLQIVKQDHRDILMKKEE